jgi:hypothetical protein
MSFGRFLALLLFAAFGGLMFSGEALAGCIVAGGTATTFACDTTGVNVLVNTGADVTLGVSDLTIEGTDKNTGFITFHNADGVSADLTLNVTNTSIDSPAYLGVFVATGDQEEEEDRRAGDITLTVDEASSITAWDAGIYARAYVSGDVKVTNYAEIFAGSSDQAFVFNGDGINATTEAGSVTLENYGDVTSYGGRGLYADGGFVEGDHTVSIYNEGDVESFGTGPYMDTVRAVAQGSFGADAVITNYGSVTGHDRRAIFAWSESGDVTISNYGEVTSYGGQAIYGSAVAGAVTITNDAKVRVIDSDPQTADVNDTSFAGIEAEVDGTGDIDVKNLDDGDILTYDNGIYAHTGSGTIEITNDGKIVAGQSGIRTESTVGDVTIDNTGTVFANGSICHCEEDAQGAVTVRGTNLGDVEINNKTGGVIVANADLDFTPTARWLDQASIEDLTDLAASTSSAYAIGAAIDGADSFTITNDGTIIGAIAVGTDDEINQADFGIARIVNNGLWVSSYESGFAAGAGVIENTGRWQTLGATLVYGDVENSGDMVATALAGDGGIFFVDGDYVASGNASLVLQWPDESLVGLSPALIVLGVVSGSTEVVIGSREALAAFDWNGTPEVPVVVATGMEDADAGHFYMEDTGYGMLSFKLLYDDSQQLQKWYIAADTTDSSEALADIPFAARNLFKLATEGVSDRLDEIRQAYAANRGGDGPLGYAASPDDPVTAALSISTPSHPTTDAWVKTTGRYGQGDGYDVLSGVIEAGIDTLADTGAGTLAYGAFGGTGASQLDFALADTEATLSGPLIGAYANYSSDRAFLGVIAAVQSLNVDLTLSGADASFGGLTYGGRIDAGYRFGDELIVEPAVALAASHTEFDTFEMNAMDVGFVDTDSLSAEARLRVARDFALDGVTVTPFAVATIGNEFLGGDGVDAPPSEVFMGNNGGLYGELSGGVTVANEGETLSGFAKGSVGYSAGELSGGLRLGANAAF